MLVRVPLGAMRDVEFPLRGDGLLDLPRADRALRDAATLWIAKDIAVYEGDTSLGRRRSRVCAWRCRPIDPSSRSNRRSPASLGPPLPADTTLVWNQALLDVLLEYPIRSDRSTFSLRPTLARLGHRVVTVLRYQPPAGAERAFELTGDPGLVRMDPRWHQAAWRFVTAGFFHILDGTDHLLFLFCLVIPVRRFRSLVLVVTAFTLAHSITLIASAFGFAPGRIVVSPARGNADRGVHPVHGAREHRRHPERAAAVDARLCLRSRARVRVFVRVARNAAVRRLAPRDVAAGVQRRRGDRPAARARRPRAGAAAPVPLRGRRAHRHHHPVGAGGPHGVALDRGAMGAAAAVRVAGRQPAHADRWRALAHGRRRGRRHRLADRCKLPAVALRATADRLAGARASRYGGQARLQRRKRSRDEANRFARRVRAAAVRRRHRPGRALGVSGQTRPAAASGAAGTFIPSTKNGDWPSYTGDARGSRYSPLDQITASNFNDLEVAWRFKTDSLGTRPEFKLEGTPLVVKGVLYTTAGTRRSVIALDAATGELLWVHRYPEGTRGANAPRQLSGRGLAYWTDGRGDERIIYFTPGLPDDRARREDRAAGEVVRQGRRRRSEGRRGLRQQPADRSGDRRDRHPLDAGRSSRTWCSSGRR